MLMLAVRRAGHREVKDNIANNPSKSQGK